jgi:hypothetical protein
LVGKDFIKKYDNYIYGGFILRKLLCFIIIVLFLSSCSDNGKSSEQGHNVAVQDFQIINKIVESPVELEVTYEIWEKLIGKYVVEDIPESYFEIKSDGSAEISIEGIQGTAKYTSDIIYLTVFYDMGSENVEGVIIISFNLSVGTPYGFPGGTLSFDFNGSPNCFTFYYVGEYGGFYGGRFIKEE